MLGLFYLEALPPWLLPVLTSCTFLAQNLQEHLVRTVYCRLCYRSAFFLPP